MDKELMKRNIRESDLTAIEKLYLEMLVDDKTVHRRWIPCNERMPQDMQKVLVCTKKSKHAMQATYCVYGEVYCDFDVAGGGYLLVDAVTHWMPLPEPPEV